MPRRGGQAHVATIKTKGKGGTEYTSYLLRRSYREGGKVRHENLGNLSHLPLEVIDAIRKMLSGRVLVDLDEQLADSELAAARARRRGAGRAQGAGSGAAAVAGALPRAGSGGRDDLPAGDRAVLEAVDDPALSPDHARRRAGAGRGDRARAAGRDGLAARPPGTGREHARAPSPHRRRVRALRPVLQLRGGALLPARGARAQPRRQAGQAAGQLGAGVLAGGTPGGGPGAPGQHRRPDHRPRCDRHRPRAVRDRAGDPRRRPGDDHRRARRRRSRSRAPGSCPR